MKRYFEKLKKLPMGISGTCLAFITLSNTWKLKDINFLKPLAIYIALFMVISMIIRVILYPKVVYEEIKDPVLGTFYPTIGMATWLLSQYFYPYFPVLCSVIWIVCAVYHYGIALFYTIIRIKEWEFDNIMPTCFIIYTGMITGSVASKGMDGVFDIIPKIADFMLMFGFIFYTILLPLVLYIVFKSEGFGGHKVPTVGIICSPAPLGVVGILTIDENPSNFMLAWLVITGLILLFVVYGYIIKLFKEGFKPAYAAFTFPLAIACLAAYKLNVYLKGLGYSFAGDCFKLLGDMEIFIATYVVLFILLNFINMFVKALWPKLGEALEKEEEILEKTLYSEEDFEESDF